MKKIRIQEESSYDIPEIHNLNKQAFKRDDEADLVSRLRMSDEYLPALSLVAVTEKGNIVGHIMFSRIVIRGKQNFSSLSLAPMAVDPNYQKSGIGTAMVKEGLDRAKELGFTSVIVLGHPDYYPRFGFKPASKWNIKPPFEAPNNAFMAIELIEGILESASGTVEYSPVFQDI